MISGVPHVIKQASSVMNFQESTLTCLKAVCHVSDWPLQSELNTTEFFVNLCICNKEGLMFLTFYGRRKSEDHQPFKFPIICIVIITQSNA